MTVINLFVGGRARCVRSKRFTDLLLPHLVLLPNTTQIPASPPFSSPAARSSRSQSRRSAFLYLSPTPPAPGEYLTSTIRFYFLSLNHRTHNLLVSICFFVAFLSPQVHVLTHSSMTPTVTNRPNATYSSTTKDLLAPISLFNRPPAIKDDSGWFYASDDSLEPSFQVCSPQCPASARPRATCCNPSSCTNCCSLLLRIGSCQLLIPPLTLIGLQQQQLISVLHRPTCPLAPMKTLAEAVSPTEVVAGL